MNNKKIDLSDTQSIIVDVGDIQVIYSNHISACLEVLDFLLGKVEKTEKDSNSFMWLDIQISEVMDVIKQLLKAPLENNEK